MEAAQPYLGRQPIVSRHTIQFHRGALVSLKVRDDRLSETLSLVFQNQTRELNQVSDVAPKVFASLNDTELYQFCTFFHRGSLITSWKDYKAVAGIFVAARTIEFLSRYTAPEDLAAVDFQPRVTLTATGARRVTLTAVVVEHDKKRTRRDLLVSRFTYVTENGKALILEKRKDYLRLDQLDPVQILEGDFEDVVMDDLYTVDIKSKLDHHLPLLDLADATLLIKKRQ